MLLNQRIGIGTATPTGKFHIVSSAPNITLEDTGANGSAVSIIEDVNGFFKIRNDSSNVGTGSGIGFEIDASERMRIDSSGRLLIGTTTEGHSNADDLTIATSGHTGISLRSGTSNNGSVFFSDGTSGADEYRGWIQYTHTTDYLTFGTNASERIRIDSSGRLLVGTTSSRTVGGNTQKILQIETTDATAGIAITRNSATSTASMLSFGKSRGTSNGTSTIVQDDDQLGRINFCGADGTDTVSEGAKIEAFVDGTPGSNDMPGRLTFSTTADGAVSATERIRIDSSGNVGIGTTSPSSALHVDKGLSGSPLVTFHQTNGNSSADAGLEVETSSTGTYIQRWINSASEKMRVTGNGLVGIGTASPSQRLEVSGNLKVTSGLALLDNDQRVQWGSSNVAFIEGNDDEKLVFGVAAEHMRIVASGNVGIGTSSPSANLHLKDGSGNTELKLQGGASTANDVIAFLNSAGSTRGNITYDTDNDFVLFNVNTSERMRIDSSGNVGIGTTSPTGRLNLAVGASTACVLRLTSNNTGSGSGDRGRIEVFSSKNDGTAFEVGQLVLDRTSTTEAKGKFQVFLNNDSGVEKEFEVLPGGNTGFNGSSAANCAIDIEGNQVDIGNPLGNGVSNGINPTFRALVVNKNIVFSSMWGGDNQLHKHLEFSGGANIFYVGTDDSEIARTDGNGLVVGSTSFDSNNSIGIRLLAHGCVHSTRDSEYAYVGRRSNSNGGMFLFRRDSTDVGNISVTTSATSYNSGSDYRLKQDDTPLIDGLTRLKQLKPIKFKWKNDTSQFVDGFFAHEVSSIVPNAITGEKDAVYEKDDELGHKKGDPIYQQIDHGKLVPLLVAALQEEIVKREELEARVAALEAA